MYKIVKESAILTGLTKKTCEILSYSTENQFFGVEFYTSLRPRSHLASLGHHLGYALYRIPPQKTKFSSQKTRFHMFFCQPFKKVLFHYAQVLTKENFEKKCNGLVTYIFEIHAPNGVQACKNQNQKLKDPRVGVLHYLGPKMKSCPIMPILVPQYFIGTLSIPAKFQLSRSSQLGVIALQTSRI